MPDDFVHLHVHSEFSLLDGLGLVDRLVARAQRLGQPALALTDHGAMHGVIPFFRACNAAGIKPLIGVEAYLTRWGRPMEGRDAELDKDRHHLLLLAQNQTGYKNLLQICSDAQMQGYYYKPRIDADYLAAHSEGLIATTGCLAAEVPTLLSPEGGTRPQARLARERLRWYLDVFGKERFFIELQEHDIPSLRQVNKTLFDWARRDEVGLVVTNDVHYVEPEDATYHDVLLCVQTGSLITQQDRMRLSDDSYYLKSGQEMRDLFRPLIDLPQSAFTNTLRIAEMCQVDLEDRSFHLPDIDIPQGHTYQTYLRELTEEGLKRRYDSRANDPEVQARKEHELAIIHQMGFDVYFLIVGDLCRYARSRNIWFNVRGSGAGSIVAYAIGITSIDPLANNLVFERFLNPGRVTMPDFDLDFPDDQREEMIRYTIDKYGSDHVAQIVAFGRMKARAAVRDVGRAMDIPLPDVDSIAKLIPAIPGKPVTIKQALGKDPKKPELAVPDLVARYGSEDYVRELLDTASALEGVARHASTHAAAVIVTDRPLTEYLPVMRPQKAVITESVTQFEFPICESIGLLKVDFLGLRTLTIMREATGLIYERHGKSYTLENIPLDDPETYKLLSSGEVAGVFQVEGAGLRRMLVEMQPHEFNHIVAGISLYRPGPIEFIPKYIRVMHGEEEAEFVHPALEPILGETYGICIYQEQVIRLLTDIAGYTAGEADLVRRAISKKKEKVLIEHREIFARGAREKSGLSRSESDQIWDALMGFARYGFNRAHAADYAVITVETAYLKAHYPLEYMAALLLVERDNTEKVAKYITECRRMGIEVLPPDVNASGMDFTLQQLPADAPPPEGKDPRIGYPFPVPERAAIRYGLAAIKNVGEGPVEAILEAREEAGPFRNLEDFCERVDLRRVGKRALECLIKVGALDQFGERAQLLAAMDQLIGISRTSHDAAAVGQLSMFDLLGGDAAASVAPALKLPQVEPLPPKERLLNEKELLGVYVSAHPLQQMSVDLSDVITCTCGELDGRYAGQHVVLAGNIVRVNQITTKKGKPMAFVTLEDLQGQVDVVVFPRTWQETREMWQEDKIVLVRGKADLRGDSANVLCEEVRDYVVRVQAADDGEDPYASLRTGPVFRDANGKGSAVASFAPAAPVEEELAFDHGVTGPDDDGNPFAHEEPDWLREAAGGEQLSVVSDQLSVISHQSSVISHQSSVISHQSSVSGEQAVGEAQRAEVGGQRSRVGESEVEEAAGSGAEAGGTESLVGGGKEDAPGEAMRGEPGAPDEQQQPVTGWPASRPEASSPAAQPAPPAAGARSRPPYQLQITIQRTLDAEKDKKLLTWVYDLLRKRPGPDRFCVVLKKNGSAVQLDFPNDRTTFDAALEQQLVRRLGAGNVAVRELSG